MNNKEVVIGSVNINDRIRFRLTDYGEQILRKWFLDLNLPHTEDKDENGWYDMQLWDVLNYFGAYVYMGNRQIFVQNEIELLGLRSNQKIKELEAK